MGYSISFSQFIVFCILLYILFGNPLSLGSIKLFKEGRNKQLLKESNIVLSERALFILKNYPGFFILKSGFRYYKSSFLLQDSLLKNKQDLNNFLMDIDSLYPNAYKHVKLLKIDSDRLFKTSNKSLLFLQDNNINIDITKDRNIDRLKISNFSYEFFKLQNHMIIASSEFIINKLEPLSILKNNFFSMYKDFIYILDNFNHKYFTNLKENKNLLYISELTNMYFKRLNMYYVNKSKN